MKGQRIVLSDAAVSDILEQADWYESQADYRLAERWEKAVTATLLRIVKHRIRDSGAILRQRSFLTFAARWSQAFPSTWFSIDFATSNCSFFALSMALVIWRAFFENKENCAEALTRFPRSPGFAVSVPRLIKSQVPFSRQHLLYERSVNRNSKNRTPITERQ